MSFDLDGDGYVGNKDYVLSKVFDKDGDGKLNQEERKNADLAIKAVSLFEMLFVTVTRESKINFSGTLSSLALIESSEYSRSEVNLSTLKISCLLRKPTQNIHFPK